MRFDDWNNDELYHHGIPKQRWGIRRFQNEDGSLTPAGRLRYLKNGTNELNRKGNKAVGRLLRSRNVDKNADAIKIIRSLGKDQENHSKSEKIDKMLFSDVKNEKKAGSKLGFSKSIRTQARSMSTEELKTAIERLQLEKQYSDLMKGQNKTFVSTGAEVVGNMFRKSIDNIGTQAMTFGLGQAINKIAKSDVVNPKKGQKDK